MKLCVNCVNCCNPSEYPLLVKLQGEHYLCTHLETDLVTGKKYLLHCSVQRVSGSCGPDGKHFVELENLK